MSLGGHDTRGVASELRRPFAPEVVLWRAMRPAHGWESTAEIAPYIDRSLVIDRLNLVCPGEWRADYRVAPGRYGRPIMWCALTVAGVTHTDVGTGTGKGLVSDALKRAASQHGVGVSLRSVPRLRLPVGTSDRAKLKGRGPEVEVTDAGRLAAALHYRQWLEATGLTTYGPVLEHIGSAATGDPGPGDAPAGSALAADLVREAQFKRIQDLSALAGIEAPVVEWDASPAERDAIIRQLEELATGRRSLVA